MQTILTRLHALERQPLQMPSASLPAIGQLEPGGTGSLAGTPPGSPPPSALFSRSAVGAHGEATCGPAPRSSSAAPLGQTSTDALVDAIRSINTAVKSNQPYYISNFDPNLHDIEVWCQEVDRARVANNWSDNECLSRIGNCLKGDARTWMNEWVTNDRSWSNFKREFKPLCPKKPDIANILFEVMKTNSDSYPTYADYARRSLLRLRIVSGLSEELISAIVIRGITDPQIRAAATNAKLMPKELVEFFSIYIKPNAAMNNLQTIPPRNQRDNSRFRCPPDTLRKRRYESGKCFTCGLPGHLQSSCSKKPRVDNASHHNPVPSVTAASKATP
ncbi:hypothetical protein ABMA28_006194 [Loxostege sticticalis]|uniref:CCHC-type domain-containing protein n=1 Tax=Loxostege sticticalis TaxID=481309 RepID=A0ABD0SL30_LOXSC